jgi:predicted permease
MFTDEFRNKLTDFLVLIGLPCMIFKSFLTPFSMDMIVQGGVSLAASAAVAFVALVLGKFLYNRYAPQEKSIQKNARLQSAARHGISKHAIMSSR